MPSMMEGTHRVKVKAHALGRTSTGKEQLAVTFENDAGEHITAYLYFTEKTLDRTMETLTEVLGWNAEQDDHRIDALHESDTLVGNECEIVVEDDTYDGKTRPRVKWINALGGGSVLKEQMDATAAQSFANTLRRRILSAKGGPKPNPSRVAAPKPAGKAKAASPAPQADTQFDDDIPF